MSTICVCVLLFSIDFTASYRLYETSDGIRRKESGYFQRSNQPDGQLKVNGNFDFPLSDGYHMTVVFVSDEKGYRPKVSITSSPEQPEPTLVLIGEQNPVVDLDNRINTPEKSISSAAVQSLVGGGLGK